MNLELLFAQGITLVFSAITIWASGSQWLDWGFDKEYFREGLIMYGLPVIAAVVAVVLCFTKGWYDLAPLLATIAFIWTVFMALNGIFCFGVST